MSKRDLNHWLIHHAARGAPASLSERLEEEWLADLADRRSTLSRLRFALGCCWATRVIAHELGASNITVASAAGSRNLTDHFNGETGLSSRRSMTFILVVALHVAVFTGLMTKIKFHVRTPTTFVTQVLTPPHARDFPPPLPPPVVVHTRIDLPPLENPPVHEDDDGSVIDARPLMPSTPNDATTETPRPVVTHVQGGPGAGFPTADDYYPSAAKRMEEEGVATIQVCVDPKGRLTSDPKTVQSSGSPRLDQGALLLAKAGSGHYHPSTEDGRPVDSCYPFRVRFQLRK